MQYAAIYIIWNILVFALYGADKSKAKKGRWRISENMLIFCAFLFGGIGAWFGMIFFRHKTRHMKFKILLPAAVLFNILVIAAILNHSGALPDMLDKASGMFENL